LQNYCILQPEPSFLGPESYSTDKLMGHSNFHIFMIINSQCRMGELQERSVNCAVWYPRVNCNRAVNFVVVLQETQLAPLG